jgi:hypothetical protein
METDLAWQHSRWRNLRQSWLFQHFNSHFGFVLSVNQRICNSVSQMPEFLSLFLMIGLLSGRVDRDQVFFVFIELDIGLRGLRINKNPQARK